jgi:hypothetical protein
MPNCKFNLAVGELPPVLNDQCKAGARRLIDNFPGFASRGINGQREYLNVLRVGHPVCQITRTNEHVGTPRLMATSTVVNIRMPTLEDRQSEASICPHCPPGTW